MSKNTLFIIIALTIIWIILSESFTIATVLIGIVISTGSIYICRRLLPLPKIANINIFRFAVYLFYLAGHVYLSAFNAMKLIITGADVDIIEVKTQISNSFLRTILANSFTLTPGSASLKLKDDTISLLWLKGKKETRKDVEKAAGLIKGKLERQLLKVE